MSGGTFDYKQYELQNIAYTIEQAIRNESNPGKDEYGQSISQGFSKDTLEVFRNTVWDLRKVLMYVQRIDWLLSGDDGEKSFHKRLQEDEIALRKREFEERGKEVDNG